MANGRRSRVGSWLSEWHTPSRWFLMRHKTASSAKIDEIAQEVFLRLLRCSRTELIDFPQAYLSKIAANVSAERATPSNRSVRHNSTWLTDLADALSPQIQVEREAADAELELAVKALPTRCREILRQHFAEGVCHEDIARRLSLPRGVIERDLARAYAALRTRMNTNVTDWKPVTLTDRSA
jgi:RNA polymerase sigma factor (sigma-70 family)